MITGDFHMHTSFSTDCQSDIESMLEGAVNKGMKVVCITDHWDQDFPENMESRAKFCFGSIWTIIFRNWKKSRRCLPGK